jgi:hypothetical protein
MFDIKIFKIYIKIILELQKKCNQLKYVIFVFYKMQKKKMFAFNYTIFRTIVIKCFSKQKKIRD